MKFHTINLLISASILYPTFASDRPQDVEAQYNRSMMHFKKHENDQLPISTDLLKLHIESTNGDAKAQGLLGEMYQFGHGVKKDFLMATQYHLLAADQNLASSQYNLGVIYNVGLGGIQDYALALKYYQLAAGQKFAAAQHNIGVMYRDAIGVDQDYVMALMYFKLAADEGFIDSQFNIGSLYWNGQGVKKNPDIAIKYFTLAAQKGCKNAKDALKELIQQTRQDEKLEKEEKPKTDHACTSNSVILSTRNNLPLPSSAKNKKNKNKIDTNDQIERKINNSPFNKTDEKEKFIDIKKQISSKTTPIICNELTLNLMKTDETKIDMPMLVLEKPSTQYIHDNTLQPSFVAKESKEEKSKDKQPTLISRAKTLTRTSSRGKIIHTSMEGGESNEDFKAPNVKSSQQEEKFKEKSIKSKRHEITIESSQKKPSRVKIHEGSKSITKSLNDIYSVSLSERNSVSRSERSSVSKSEISGIEEAMGIGEFAALVAVLRDRDILSVSQTKLTRNIILDTLLTLEKKNLIEVKRSKTNKNKIRATLKGPYLGSKRPSLTIHMHDHDKPWNEQKRAKKNFLDLIEACGLDIKDILKGEDSIGEDAGEASAYGEEDLKKI